MNSVILFLQVSGRSQGPPQGGTCHSQSVGQLQCSPAGHQEAAHRGKCPGSFPSPWYSHPWNQRLTGRAMYSHVSRQLCPWQPPSISPFSRPGISESSGSQMTGTQAAALPTRLARPPSSLSLSFPLLPCLPSASQSFQTIPNPPLWPPVIFSGLNIPARPFLVTQVPDLPLGWLRLPGCTGSH